jgi:chemotaxis signal transduction protein
LPERDPNTTQMLDDLFSTLRRYSQTSKVSDDEILRQRARQYAERTEPEQSPDELVKLLMFGVDDYAYGLDVMRVKGIRKLPLCTRVPGSQPFFIGAANVRGSVVTVMDLRHFVDGVPTDRRAEMILIEHSPYTIGLAVTTVYGVHYLPHNGITALDEARYTQGTVRTSYGQTAILSPDEIFTDPRFRPHANE